MRNDEFVCGDCFSDKGMKDYCETHAESRTCDFCDAKKAKPIAARLDEVIEHISTCIGRYFDDPANAGAPYESAEGGWQVETYDTSEVFEELGLSFPNDDDGRLSDAIEGGIENDLWCKAELYGLTDEEKFRYSWRNFCNVIKHQRRYFFFHEAKKTNPRHYDEIFSPADTLRAIFSFAKAAGSFVELKSGVVLYRARPQKAGEVHNTASTLGPPPTERAIQANRMSPPGIAMTYVSENRETALAETADKPGTYAVGEFVSQRNLLILDLTRLPEPPSPFAETSDERENSRSRLVFLHEIAEDISRPIARDDRMHIEYVPTQIVTEYVRTAVRVKGRAVDGIRYQSSRRNASTALVLFANQDNLLLEEEARPKIFYSIENRWLHLIGSQPFKVTLKKLKGWSR